MGLRMLWNIDPYFHNATAVSSTLTNVVPNHKLCITNVVCKLMLHQLFMYIDVCMAFYIVVIYWPETLMSSLAVLLPCIQI